VFESNGTFFGMEEVIVITQNYFKPNFYVITVARILADCFELARILFKN